MKLTRILSVLLSLCLLSAGLPAVSEALEPTGEAELSVSSEDEIEAVPEDTGPEAPLWALEAEEEAPVPSPEQAEEALFANAAEDTVQENAVPSGEIPIDAEHFPNLAFRYYVLNNFDTDNSRGLSQAEIAAVKKFNWSSPHYVFASIKGIEYFTAIEKLYYAGDTISDELEALDLSQLSALQELTVSRYFADRLDLSRNTALSKLTLSMCELKTLELGQCDALTEIKLLVVTIPQVDLRAARSLKTVDICGNAIDRLYLGGSEAFTELELSSNHLKELVLGDNPNLKKLFCIANQLTTLNIQGCGQLCALVNSTLPLSDVSKYYPDCPVPVQLYIDESTGCELVVDNGVVVLYGFVPVASIQLSKTKLDLKAGKKKTLEAKVLPENASNPTLDWSSSDESVATVNSNGRITAKGPGKATITAAAKDGSGVKATCKVTVPSSISLDKTKATVKVGKSVDLKATAKVASGKPKGVKWASSNENVATVSNGKVTAKKPGKATITATLKDGSGLKAKCKITVPTVVKLNKTKATVKLGKKLPLEATCKDAKGKDPGIRWSSSDNNVATVNSKGVVTAKGYGDVTITAKAKDGSGGKATCKVTVPASTKVQLTRSKMKLALDKTVSLSAIVTTESGKSCGIRWSSSKPSIVSVSTKGVIIAKKAGKATITATAKDGSNASDSCEVEVYAPGRTSVALNLNNIRVKANRNIWLGSKVKTADGSTPEIAWSTSDGKVAKVSGNGYTCIVSTKKPGTAIITAKAKDGSGAVDTCEIVVVEESAVTVTLTDDHLTLLPGDIQTIIAEVDNGTGNPPGVTWKSSDSQVASVSNGKILAMSPGKANITATVKGVSGVSAICRVVVASIPVTSIELDKSSIELRKDQQVFLKAKVGPASATNKGLVWTSSDNSIATVDNNGKITTKQKKGKVTITATAADGSGVFASCEVEVVIPAYRALLIGEGNFPGAEINRNRNDVDNMYSMLNRVQGPTGESYTAYPYYDKSTGEILELIDKTFAGADEHDVSLFFIATHGDIEGSSTQAGKLSTVNSKGEEGVLILSVLADKLRQVPGSIVVILESCGSGAAVYGNSADSRSVRQSVEAFNKAAVRAFSRVDDGIVVSDLAANTGEFRMENKFYVLTASDFQEKSYGYIGDRYNWFTKWLIDGVGVRGNRPADKQYAGNNDGIVNLNELYSYIAAVGNNTQVAFFQYQHVQVYPSGSDFGLFK